MSWATVSLHRRDFHQENLLRTLLVSLLSPRVLSCERPDRRGLQLSGAK
ncbi:hypothetical protein RE6C_04977 [Rhodopirellula europaea 6C]|uniref:Uncharacterized protein n=1 Tax=Rhodopirellula europaea 6C TaxID=1263867 RepID=M2ACF4_9BACT|nr:hypothetical protein RE6C_04977 [Rhodopirellula europaea 6C]